MLAYAAHTPASAVRARSPGTMTLIIAGHIVLVAAALTVKMDITPGTPFDPVTLIDIAVPQPPPPDPQAQQRPEPRRDIQDSSIDRPRKLVDMGQTTPLSLDQGPTIRELIADIGPGIGIAQDPPRAEPVRTAAVARTPENALRPPYPLDKLRLEEEAVLKLRLTIDTRGRVTAVDPLGPADPSFLSAARRHILKAWRYKPATEDGVAVGSTLIINLSFRLETA